MDKMICSRCGKEITEKPCPHCGSESVTYRVSIAGSLIVSGASTSIVHRAGQVKTFDFDPGVSSADIVNASLPSPEFDDVVPQPIRDQIIYNINTIESQADKTAGGEITHEHSFELNLGIFKYKWKRTKKS